MFKQVYTLIAKDLRIELRQRFAINSVLLYVFSAVFFTYLSLQNIDGISFKILNAVFWIILTFTSVNAVSKSFIQETESRRHYYFSLAKANAVLVSKMIYNTVLVLIISLLCFFVFALFLSFSPENIELFMMALVLGSIGYSSILTMVSAIAAKTNANFALVAVLSFPLILPLLLLLIKITNMPGSYTFYDSFRYLLILLFLDVIIWALSLLLFPYVWRD
ncbi:MAG TPA: heme exporter protein CcmB [Bacteroidales bacterium]|nr:heme exporter protein CcmB [Bacteroidales bacterium]HPS16270.1 heme exporter protein CcmB [Bacteroidales bacterium]